MVRVVGHRGAAGHAPENTLLGFERGIELGADVIEFDVRESADGVPMVIHNETVDGTTDGSGAVNELTVEELKQLDAGDGATVPTLDETLDLIADHDVDARIEPKDRGFDVGLWTPNEPDEIESALALGPEYVCSDYPDRVRDQL